MTTPPSRCGLEQKQPFFDADLAAFSSHGFKVSPFSGVRGRLFALVAERSGQPDFGAQLLRTNDYWADAPARRGASEARALDRAGGRSLRAASAADRARIALLATHAVPTTALQRRRTSPFVHPIRDRDGDGIADGQDTLPQVAARSRHDAAAEVIAAALDGYLLGGGRIVEGIGGVDATAANACELRGSVIGQPVLFIHAGRDRLRADRPGRHVRDRHDRSVLDGRDAPPDEDAGGLDEDDDLDVDLATVHNAARTPASFSPNRDGSYRSRLRTSAKRASMASFIGLLSSEGCARVSAAARLCSASAVCSAE